MSFNIVGIGELLWDMLPRGRQLGGAPANFAYHACALGAKGRIVSRVGDDAAGRDLLARLAQLSVLTDCIQIDPTAPTGSVSVELSPLGQPRYFIRENVAWDYLAPNVNASCAVKQADAVCFGTLAQRSEMSRNTIHELIASTPQQCLRVLDVNLRQHFYTREIIEKSLALANVLKLNEDELPVIAEIFSVTGDSRSQLARFTERFNLRAAALTRGDHGALLLSDGHWSDNPRIPTTVVDTVGAGDSFTAAMVIGLLVHWDLDEINEQANRVAAFVVSRIGATPPLENGLTRPFLKAIAGQ